MEEGVLNEILKSPVGELFDTNQFLSDVSGSGNNWCDCASSSVSLSIFATSG